MRVICALAVALFLGTGVSAEEKWFGDWAVISDGSDMVAATQRDNFSKVLAYRCFNALGKCVHVLIAGTVCDDGHTYPVLVSSEHSALSMNTICSMNDGRGELILTEYDLIHAIIQKSQTIGIAVPMTSGQFKVVRFSLKGSSQAMDYAEKHFGDSAEYL